MTDQRLEGHLINVVGLNAIENLVVQVGGLLVGQSKQDVAEADVGIAAVQLKMDLAQAEATAEIDRGWANVQRRRDRSRWPPTSSATRS